MTYIEQNFGDGSDDAYVLNGLGENGAAAREFLGKLPAGRWVAFVSHGVEDYSKLDEAILKRFKDDPHFKCFAGPDLGAVRGGLQEFLISSEAFSIRILTPPAPGGTSQFQLTIAQALQDAINRRQVEINTLLTHAEPLTRNSIKNLVNLSSSHAVSEYEGKLAGRSAVVVAAGPSLTEALPYLQKHQDKLFIICVGKAYRLLTQKGIVPHVVVQLDLLGMSSLYYEGVVHDPRTALLWDGDSHPAICSTWTGPKINTDCGVAVWEWARRFSPGRSVDWRCMTVAHSSFCFARLLGCDPIMLVGVDLSLPGENTHAEGTPFTWGGKVADLGEMNYIDIPSVTGRTVKALPNFRSYVTGFEVLMADTKAKVFQTSPAGAMIRGAECKGIEAALGTSAPSPLDVFATLGEIHAKSIAWDEPKFQSYKWTALQELTDIVIRCGAAERWLNQMRYLSPTNKKEAPKFARLEERTLKARDEIVKKEAAIKLMKRLTSITATEMQRINKELQTSTSDKARISLLRELLTVFFAGHSRAAEICIEELGKL